MFEFAWPWAFALLPLPLLARWLLPAAKSASAALWLPQARFLRPADTSGIQSQHRLWLLPLLIWLSILATIAQPHWLSEPIPINPEAREIMIALDLSGSMEMDDMTYNGRRASRLEAAHKILADFIRRRQGDRIGLIVYADSAHVYVPISSDLETVAQLAEEARIGLAGERTALGDAIALSIRYFNERETSERVVLMITDGMINSGAINAEQAIHLARNHDVKIHTIGIGAEEMTVRGLFGERRINPSSDLDESFLATIAGTTGGEYFRAKSEGDMESIYAAIDSLEPISSDEQFFRPHTSLAHWPLAFGLGLFFIYFIRLIFGQQIWQRLTGTSE
ncbi:Mg-chelatase subunit ChlD [Idiomarina sp. A28L]|uniref:VWA domain-containing protein n=1 Tax=Idiomarina sp. A28L TaxID=1036674 RepID=UPI0002138611|nr:VWA domain-containing protein [Idiomarina sp. A28L]EGN76340.1 Mg-chelatase subunit ChlD [Idiomarina sp. A28L]